MKDEYIIHTDGGARGNPGPSAVGIVIEKNNVLIYEGGEKIGESTNNIAEYTAVKKALQILQSKYHDLHGSYITFYIDANLVVQQLNGLFKIKNANLRELVLEIKMLEQEIGGVIIYRVIPREKNLRADFLVNQALDG